MSLSGHNTETGSGDAVLVARALDRDEEACRELVRRYEGLVYGCTWSVLGNDADARDAAQNAFIRFFRHLEQYDPRRPLKPYLLRVAVNAARSLARRRTRERSRLAEDADLGALADTIRSPDATAVRREGIEAVRTLITHLPDRLREVCSLFYLSECSCREVASILDIGESAVKVALHRARRRLLRLGISDWRTV